MERSKVGLLLLLSAIVVSSWVPISECAKKPVGLARKEDVPYIKCQVCEKIAHQLYQQAEAKQAEISPKKISEYQIIEIAENVCNLKKHEADWILKIDIVEQGDKLKLVEQDSEGICNSECKTIERACQDVMGYSDTDVAEYIYKKKPQIDSLVNFLCKDLTSACTKKPPSVPKDRIPGEAFMAKPTKDAEMDSILKSMEGMPGAPNMKMYSREELTNMNNFGGEDADEDDDEDEAELPSKLKQVLRKEPSKKSDWKQTITQKVAAGTKVLKGHATKISNKLQKWWTSKKGSLKKKKTGKSEL